MDTIILKYFSHFSPKQQEQITALKPLYEDWNQKINVISRKDMENFYLHHVLHSLSIATQFDLLPGRQILDLGTGGGFPGLPLAILFPETEFHLVDSINKKLKVVQAVVENIGLKNVTTAHTRAEDIKGRKFDAVVSRAVAPLKDLIYWTMPLVKRTPSVAGQNMPNGLICLKGGDLSAEIHESGVRPMVWDIQTIYKESWFTEKYLLYIKY